MPTYGEKWRASSDSSACDTGHVSRSHRIPILRLDSTGEISSVEHTREDKAQLVNTTTQEMNGNSVNMKNWFVNRVLGVSGTTNLTGKKTSVDTDINANLMDRITNCGPGMSTNTMDSRYQNQNFVQPNCRFSGWSNPGQSFNRFGVGTFLPFPCHQFANSFNAGHCGQDQPRMVENFINPEFQYPSQLGANSPLLNDQHWKQRTRKCDRSYRGHSPKHHKPDHKNKKIQMAHEKVPSKCVKMEQVECDQSLAEVCDKTGGDIDSSSYSIQSKDAGAPQVDSTIEKKCSLTGNCKPQNTETNMVEKSKKSIHDMEAGNKTFICDITKDSNHSFNINITGSNVEHPKMTESERSTNVEETDNKPESNIQVLFIRKDKKKGRPSSGKQRRRKQQKAKSMCSASEVCAGTKAEVNVDDVDGFSNYQENGCNSTVSFILGLSQSPSSPLNGTSGVVFSFSDDEMDDDSDDTWESDFDIEAEFSQCGLLNFMPNNNLLPNSGAVPSSPFNFQLRISPIQNKVDDQDKTLEDINTSWNVQISVKENGSKPKKNPTKRVHFPEDDHLSVVHPMIAWSYAYQAARKGHWENFVRDRDRFKRRISEAENVLLPVLNQKHRAAVFADRFNGN